ncbi:MAG: undecaprenyl-diphosphate phosphatase [Gammaproteobacteria bacterium]|jgi:undecaprenyl-diphosphatase
MATEYLHYLVLGLIQGITEFLPISSSAHLILVPRLLNWHDQGLAVDVAAHVGSLCAVIFYFRRDLKRMLVRWYTSGFSLKDDQSLYVWYLAAATLPIAIIGFLSSDYVELYLRSPLVIAGTTIVFGLLLWWADYAGKQTRDESGLSWKDVFIIGAFQVLALIPGTSRSGITMSAGLLLGLNRASAARFAFLLSVPTILLAGGYEGLKLILSSTAVNWIAFLIVVVTSFITAVFTIHYFLKFLNQTGMLPYVIYRLLLGATLLYLFI